MQIDLLPGSTICEETTREDMIGTIYGMVQPTPKRNVVRSSRAGGAKNRQTPLGVCRFFTYVYIFDLMAAWWRTGRSMAAQPV